MCRRISIYTFTYTYISETLDSYSDFLTFAYGTNGLYLSPNSLLPPSPPTCASVAMTDRESLDSGGLRWMETTLPKTNSPPPRKSSQWLEDGK